VTSSPLLTGKRDIFTQAVFDQMPSSWRYPEKTFSLRKLQQQDYTDTEG